MPSFPLVMHSWLSELIIAIIYNITNFYGLAVLFAAVNLGILFAIYTYFKTNLGKKYLDDSKYWRLTFLVASITVFFGFFYVRPQVFSWCFWGLFVLVISKEKLYSRYKFFLPPFFLLWTNLHGDFALPIFLLSFVNLCWIIAKRRLNYVDLSILLLSLLVTLVNPFGISLWREVFATYFNPYIRGNVSEWQPIFGYFDFSLLLMTSFSVFTLWKYRKLFPIHLVLIYVFLFIQAVLSIKNIPLWLIYSFIFIYPSINFLYKDLRDKISVERFKKAGVFVFALSVVLFISQVSVAFVGFFYSPYITYPHLALGYLENNPFSGQLFSDFDMGGYLIWKFPQKKVFVDGRMDTWNWNANLPDESNNAFRDYLDILSGKLDFNKAADKYNITTVLWPKYGYIDKNSFEYKTNKQTCELYYIGCMAIYRPLFDDRLKNDGWHEVYSDKVATVYKR